MAKVILMNHWFAPGDRLFRKSATKMGPPVEVPDEYLDFLPTTAKIVPDDYVAPKKEDKVVSTLSEYRKLVDANDPARAAMVAEGEVRKQVAEADIRTKAQVKADTQAENRAKFEKKAKEKIAAERKRQAKEFQEKLDAEKAEEEKD